MNIRTIGTTTGLSEEFRGLLESHDSLARAIADWASASPVAKQGGELPVVVVQDEYCHDVTVSWGRQRFVVYATT